jgi:hypothetical protein
MSRSSCSQSLPFRRHLHAAVAQRLGDVAARDDRRAFEVRQGAGDAQYPVVAARRETQPLGRPGEQRTAGGLGASNLVEQCPVRLGIGADPALRRQPRIARGLPGAGCRDPTRDRRAALGGGRQREVRRRYRTDIDVQVDAVEQRARQPALVVFRATRRSPASELRKMAAAARVHRRDQLKARRIGYVPLGTGDADPAGLQRLAQRFERGAVELGQFVKKQDP